MEKQFTQKDIDRFFEIFKGLPQGVTVADVENLVSNPSSKPADIISPKSNHLNLYIMTTSIAVVVLFSWLYYSNTDATEKQPLDPPVAINNVVAEDPGEILKENTGTTTVQNDAIIKKSIKPLSNDQTTLAKAPIASLPASDHSPVENPAATALKDSVREIDATPTVNPVAVPEDMARNKEDDTDHDAPADEQPTVAERNETPRILPEQFLELSNSTLQKLGFRIKKNSISYYYNNKSCKFKYFISSDGYGVSFLPMRLFKSNNPKLFFVSNNKGERSVRWTCRKESAEKMTQAYFLKQTEVLVPVKISKEQFPFVNEDKIFWLQPSPELFKALEEEIGTGIGEEYEQIINDNNEGTQEGPKTCTYFEMCRSTLHLDKFSVYPNPVQQETTIQVELHEAVNGQILLLDITGKTV